MTSQPRMGWFTANVLEFVDGFKNRLETPFFPFHEHDCFEIVYHPQGRGKTTLQDGREIPFEQGGVVLYRPFDRHSQIVSTPALDVVVQFRGRNLPPEMQMSRGFRPFRQEWVNGMMMDLSRRAHRMTEQERVLLNHRVSLLVMALFVLGESYEEPLDAPVRKDYAGQIYEFLREQYQTIRKVEEVATAVGISYSHARRLFAAAYGKTIKHALIEIRLTEAKDRLASTPFSVKMISYMVGFQSESYFCATFKQILGMTPSEHRDVRARRRHKEPARSRSSAEKLTG